MIQVVRYLDAELEALMSDIESDFTERKETWRGDSPETGRQAICAFLNVLPDHRRPGGHMHQPGYVVQQHSVRLSRPVKAYLTSADGAIGNHAVAVQEAYQDFKRLAEAILKRNQSDNQGGGNS